MIFSYVKLWRQENWPFGPNPAQIQPKSQFLFPEKSPTAGLHYDDLDANQG